MPEKTITLTLTVQARDATTLPDNATLLHYVRSMIVEDGPPAEDTPYVVRDAALADATEEDELFLAWYRSDVESRVEDMAGDSFTSEQKTEIVDAVMETDSYAICGYMDDSISDMVYDEISARRKRGLVGEVDTP
jgi:hypothetical protein